MTQTAQVKALLADGRAEVSVHRKSACSHDCSECSGCEMILSNSDLIVAAENLPCSRPGDIVLVQSDNRAILSAAVMVYLVPFVLFFAGYLISQMLGMKEGISILVSFVCLMSGLLPARMLDRRVKRKSSVRFHIIEIIKPCSDI